MRDRSKIFRDMIEHYSMIRSSEEFQASEKKNTGMKKSWKARIIVWTLANIAPIMVIGFILLAIIGIISAFFLLFSDFFGGEKKSEYQPSYVNGVDYKTFFSSDAKNIPYGIPVERGVFGESIDQSRFGPKDSYGLGYYRGHTGQDFPRIFKDKLFGYNPFIFATHDGIVVLTETRQEDPSNRNAWIYTRNIYRDGTYISTTDSVRKSISDGLTVRPYGQFTVLSTLDGRYYTLYAHQSSINESIRGRTKIDRGDIIGTMGTTGNSFGVHLHYEVRDCGSNTDFRKLFRECRIINPLSFNDIIKNNYIGIDPRKTGAVYAGSVDKKSSSVASVPLEQTIKSEYDRFCTSAKPLFVGRTVTCKDVFPIVYQNRANSYYPNIPGNEDGIAGEKYVLATYGVKKEDITIEKILSISSLDGIKVTGLSADKFFPEIGTILSYGKYQNRSRIYKRQEFFSSGNETTKAEQTFLSDLITDVEKLKKKTGSIEKAYEQYYPSAGYKRPRDNPYLYNMYDGNSIFMTLMDNNGRPAGVFRESGLMTIYKNL